MVELFRHKNDSNFIYIKYSAEITLKDAITVSEYYSKEFFEQNSLIVITEITDSGYVVDTKFITEIAKLGKKVTPLIKSRVFLGLKGIQMSFLKMYQELREDTTEKDIVLDSRFECEDMFNISLDSDFIPLKIDF